MPDLVKPEKTHQTTKVLLNKKMLERLSRLRSRQSESPTLSYIVNDLLEGYLLDQELKIEFKRLGG